MHRYIALMLLILVSATAQAETQNFKDCENCPDMVIVPKGSVTIGSAEHAAFRRKGERPLTKVSIKKPFALASHEITLGQYRAFVAKTGHESAEITYQGKRILGCNYFDGTGYGFVAQHTWNNPGYPQREDEPVVCVSWSDADAYAKWLSQQTGRTYRVPSTVEFEYAWRAGSEAPWHWGTNPDLACEFANVADQTFAQVYPKRSQFACDDGYVYPTRVGRFKPNDFGLHDMLGNVWEWTNDCWHDDLTKAPTDGRSWLDEDGGQCDARVPKGGSWISGPSWGHAAVRSKDPANYRSFMLGFRVAAEVTR